MYSGSGCREYKVCRKPGTARIDTLLRPMICVTLSRENCRDAAAVARQGAGGQANSRLELGSGKAAQALDGY